jgi:hypothetical protein
MVSEPGGLKFKPRPTHYLINLYLIIKYVRFPLSTTFFRPFCPPTKIHITCIATGYLPKKRKTSTENLSCRSLRLRMRIGRFVPFSPTESFSSFLLWPLNMEGICIKSPSYNRKRPIEDIRSIRQDDVLGEESHPTRSSNSHEIFVWQR